MNKKSSESVSWTELYRPKKLSEIAGNSYAIKKFKDWADSWEKGKPKKKGAILVGSPGIGKTSAALALANDYEWDVVELNASDHRNAAMIEKIVGHGSRADTFAADGSFHPASTGKMKLIVFDEADNLFGREDYGGARAIVQALRAAAQPIVLIVNDYYELTRRASGVKSLAITIKFSNPTIDEIVSVLERISTRENLEIDHELLYRIAKNAGTDIRAAVNDLHSISFLEEKEMIEVADVLGWRDIHPEMFDALADVFGSDDPKKARLSLISLDETPDRIILWIDDNLPRVIRDPVDRCNAMDALSRADVFLGRVRKRQYYGLWSYATDLMSMGVCTSSGDRNKLYSDSLRFPEYLIRLSRTKARRNSINALLEKFSIGFHTSPEIARESILPYIRGLAIRDNRILIPMTKELELQAGEISLLLDEDSDSDKVEAILAQATEENDRKEKKDVEPVEIEPISEAQRQKSLFEFR